ncbi:MAG TPA: YihY/virulence factor BrkB family protein [Gemmatimonadaceae bacterium]|nr:YihY/virulence factor BrkB family protein [Gemmatimonadaceae bacterium]
MLTRFYWTLRDYAMRVWDNAGEDNVLFLAGGIAFNLILAALPFILLLVAGVTLILPIVYRGTINSNQAVADFIDRVLPTHAETADSPYHKLVSDLLRTRGSITLYGSIGFVWFSTRLFGSLRTVLANVFDIDNERGIIAGKIFDVKITIVSTLLFVASVTVSTYIALATKRGTSLLVTLGLRGDVMGGVEYWIGRALAFAFIALMFFALYKYLPVRRVRTKTACVAAAFTSLAFEAARSIFSVYTATFNPASLYTGTLTAIVVVVVWFYYAALIFILGGEVGQVFELRRVRRRQREVFTD